MHKYGWYLEQYISKLHIWIFACHQGKEKCTYLDSSRTQAVVSHALALWNWLLQVLNTQLDMIVWFLSSSICRMLELIEKWFYTKAKFGIKLEWLEYRFCFTGTSIICIYIRLKFFLYWPIFNVVIEQEEERVGCIWPHRWSTVKWGSWCLGGQGREKRSMICNSSMNLSPLLAKVGRWIVNIFQIIGCNIVNISFSISMYFQHKI